MINDQELIDRLRVFGFLGQFQLHDRTIINLPGISHNHPVKDIIKDVLEEEGIEANFYTINLLKSQFVPLHDLFDFDEQKWQM
ncbi:MAG: hypothetical protein FK733_16480 [Asgard group archaeon]|nr:hypothetical protein [Asgard group archaeon]